MADETKIKVKDLADNERVQLLLKMEKAGLKGVKTEYSVESARAKIAQWEAQNNYTQNTSDDKENFEINQDKPVINDAENKIENTSKTKKAKKFICHICRGEVIDGICIKCGFTLQRNTQTKV